MLGHKFSSITALSTLSATGSHLGWTAAVWLAPTREEHARRMLPRVQPGVIRLRRDTGRHGPPDAVPHPHLLTRRPALNRRRPAV